jgi:CRP/FNR family transcriptional regulator, cyclic AMP receptor protein
MSTARRELKHRVERLRSVPFIAECSFRELQRIDRLGAQIDIRAGKTLTHEGTVGRQCFVVFDGTAIAHRAGRPLGTITAGSVAGEMALLDHTTRNATVVATTPMRLLVLTDQEFAQLLDIAPSIQTALAGIAAERRTSPQLSARYTAQVPGTPLSACSLTGSNR